MKLPLSVLLLPTLLCAFSPCARANSGKIAVDVVMDFTPEGKKLLPPTEDDPTYYLPLPVGLVEKGPPITRSQQKLPSPEQIEHLIARMLAQQNYLVANKDNPPTIVLTLRWGYMAPNIFHTESDNQGQHRQPGVVTSTPNGVKAESLSSTVDLHPDMRELAEVDSNAIVMNDLVAGQFANPDRTTGTNVHDEAMKAMARSPRWYVQIIATDFNDSKVNKVTQLWRENMSTDLEGHLFDEVLPALVGTGGMFIGRPMTAPAIMTESLDAPLGWVTNGKAVVMPTK